MARKGKDRTFEKADKLLSNPQFKELILQESRNPGSSASSRINDRVTESKEFKEWVSTLPEKTRSTVLSTGLIPYLLSEDNQE